MRLGALMAVDDGDHDNRARHAAALSRSTFFERFTNTVGLPPMEYLLAWRMALAKDLLRRHDRLELSVRGVDLHPWQALLRRHESPIGQQREVRRVAAAEERAQGTSGLAPEALQPPPQRARLADQEPAKRDHLRAYDAERQPAARLERDLGAGRERL